MAIKRKDQGAIISLDKNPSTTSVGRKSKSHGERSGKFPLVETPRRAPSLIEAPSIPQHQMLHFAPLRGCCFVGRRSCRNCDTQARRSSDLSLEGHFLHELIALMSEIIEVGTILLFEKYNNI